MGPRLFLAPSRRNGKVQDLRDEIKFASSPAKVAEGKAFCLGFSGSRSNVFVSLPLFFLPSSPLLHKGCSSFYNGLFKIFLAYVFLSSKHYFGSVLDTHFQLSTTVAEVAMWCCCRLMWQWELVVC